MNVVPVEEFVPHIAPLLEKCDKFVIEREVIKTVADICRSTGCITTTSEFKTKAGERIYNVPMPEGFDAELVRYAHCDGNKMLAVTYDTLVGGYPFDWRDASGKPQYYSYRQHEELELFPVPDKEYNVKVDITVAIRMSTKVVPEMFFECFLDLVTFGTLARIHQIAGQPYTNVQLAVGYQQQYQSALADLKSEVVRDYTRTAGRVRFNRIL